MIFDVAFKMILPAKKVTVQYIKKHIDDISELAVIVRNVPNMTLKCKGKDENFGSSIFNNCSFPDRFWT
jgi:hypothetical protein